MLGGIFQTKVWLSFVLDGAKSTVTARRAIIPRDKEVRKRKAAALSSVDSDSDASEDEVAFQKFLEKGADKGKLKSQNSDWNTCHVELRKALEKSGTVDRYGIQHLSLWTDLILDGTLSGSREEPDWSKYLHVVHVEPLPKRGMGLVRARGQNDMLATFLVQQEIRREEDRESERKRQRQEELFRQERQRQREEERKLERQQNALLLSALSPVSTCSSIQQSKSPVAVTDQGQYIKPSFLPTRRQIKYNSWSPPSSTSSSGSVRESPTKSNSSVSSDSIGSDDSEPFDFEKWVKDQLDICRRIQNS